MFNDNSPSRNLQIQNALQLDERIEGRRVMVSYGWGTVDLYPGTIESYDHETKVFWIKFDNGDREDHDLLYPHHPWRFILEGLDDPSDLKA